MEKEVNPQNKYLIDLLAKLFPKDSKVHSVTSAGLDLIGERIRDALDNLPRDVAQCERYERLTSLDEASGAETYDLAFLLEVGAAGYFEDVTVLAAILYKLDHSAALAAN